LTNLGSVVGLTWLLSPEPEFIPEVELEDIIRSSEFEQSNDKQQYLFEKVGMNDDDILKLASETIGQDLNTKWLVKRRYRITASNFGPVLSAINRNKYNPSLFKKLIGTYKLDGIKSIQWGKENEKQGILEFEQITNQKVTPTGLWLHKTGIIGASPDGLVGLDSIIEVKCPYKYRNELIKTGLQNDSSYIIFYDINGRICINYEHDYYAQIQGQLHILNRSICYLTIWTIKDLVVLEIHKDPGWTENINKLVSFYFQQFIPFLNNKNVSM